MSSAPAVNGYTGSVVVESGLGVIISIYSLKSSAKSRYLSVRYWHMPLIKRMNKEDPS